jgi:16S rRNA (uracil1498-N3)-methyltransferase
MPDLRRFYASSVDADAGTVLLEGPEAHHALHVIRVRPGEEAAVFDGLGNEWRAEVAAAERKRVRLIIKDGRNDPAPPPLTLLQAWLHRDEAAEDLVRRCTELGATQILFFVAERSERVPAAERMEKKLDKYRRTAVESCKQCGRNWLPRIAFRGAFAEALDGLPPKARLGIALQRTEAHALADLAAAEHPALVIGPEGDFTDEEVDAAVSRGGMPLSLGATTFRAEVAAALGAALIGYERGLLGPRPEKARQQADGG